ncbi:hypothetical protein K4F52_000478 [Lecanicillium sp. MT-2017a]|nr:hypothetical protein K4F52_000478 [Lecanicillium sp. MT-2017a]
MKTSVIVATLSMAASIAAAPASQLQGREEQVSTGLFGGGSNLISGIFDSSACLVSSIIGGGNPNCKGKGTDKVTVPAEKKGGDNGDSSSGQYTYTFNTGSDGTLTIEITLNSGGSCKTNVKADGKKVPEVIKEEAKKCIAQKGK